MAVPNIFGTATAAIPLSQLDTNFATAITLGNTAVYLGNTTTSLGNVTLTNVLISSGNATVSNITANAVTSPAATNLLLQSAGTTAVTIDTAQNVGVGVTPSAWSGYKAFQINRSSAISSGSGSDALNITANSYYNGTNWIYSASYFATRYTNDDGTHKWFNAPSGTAGNAITFTQAMTLDASGNLRVGITSGSFSGQTLYGPNDTYLSVYAAAGRNGGLIFGGNGAENQGNLFYNASGNYVQLASTPAGSSIRFDVAGAERARIDSSGNLLVAKTATSTTTAGAEIRSADGSFYSTIAATTNATSTYNAYSTGAGAYRFYVGMAGTVFATNTAITAISDIRLKENIRDLDDGLQKVMALQPRKFDWKEGKGADIKDARGFIAQEFEIVFPDMVEEWKDTPPEGEEPYKAVNANLIPTLVKAIQEQQALITALTARITTLESK